MFNHDPDDPHFDLIGAAAAEVSRTLGGHGAHGPFGRVPSTPVEYPHWVLSLPFGDIALAWLEWEEAQDELRIACIAARGVPVSNDLYRYIATEASESTWVNLHLRANEHANFAAAVVSRSVWTGQYYGMLNNDVRDAALYNNFMAVASWAQEWGNRIRETIGGDTWHWDGTDDGRRYMRVIGLGTPF